MTEQEFKDGIDGLLNDFVGGVSIENEFRDGVLDLLIKLYEDFNAKHKKALESIEALKQSYENLTRQKTTEIN